MAQRTVVLLIDDLTGEESEDVTNVTFSFSGSDFEIDLNDANYEQFKKALAPYMDKGRRVKRARRNATSSSSGSRSSSQDTAAIRAWAKENGYEVSERGRVPQEIKEAYEKNH